jgi:phytoene synthase
VDRLFRAEQRLADTARDGRDPIMATAPRLVARPPGRGQRRWPKGEPLLAALGPWNAERAALVALVDGIEALHVGEKGPAERDAARVGIMAALARFSGGPGMLSSGPPANGRGWSLRPVRRRVCRAMRPLVLLRGLALRGEGGSPFLRFLTALRLGLLGRR